MNNYAYKYTFDNVLNSNYEFYMCWLYQYNGKADFYGCTINFGKRKKIFGENTTTRLRPSYFPFTEPSVEVDVSCFQCGGKGCKLCKGTGWIEVLGAGVVNKKVLEGCGIDTDVYSGFAFGIGIERIAMLKYGINNIKLLFESDLRVLDQIDDN